MGVGYPMHMGVMATLQEKQTELAVEFEKGLFAVHETHGYFSP